MNTKEVLELKRRFTKEKATFSRLAGCYVNEKREKVCTFLEPFQGLENDVIEKYLELAKKTLSGSLKNNLVEVEFPLSEETPGGRQQLLMGLRECGLENEALLDVFYDAVIENYSFPGHYMILLFMDRYDVPFKTRDGLDTGESDEVFSYILSCVCPVELSKPGLSYLEADKRIGARLRDWVVGLPESGFLFPSFSGRSANIHEALVYAKNPKAPHDEWTEQILGCPAVATQAQQRMSFHTIVKQVLGPEDSGTEETLLGIQQHLQDQAQAYEEAYQGEDVSPLFLSDSLLKEAMTENAVPEKDQEKILSMTEKTFGESMPEAEALVDAHALKAGAYRLEAAALTRELAEKTLEADHLEKALSQVSDFRLRPMKEGDLSSIQSWLHNHQDLLFWGQEEMDFSSLEEVLFKEMRDPDCLTFTLTDADHQPTGCMELTLSGPRKENLVLSRILVAPEKRNQGVGEALVSLEVRYAKLFLGAKEVTLKVLRENVTAVRAFQAAGFKEKSLLGYTDTESGLILEGRQYTLSEMIYTGK